MEIEVKKGELMNYKVNEKRFDYDFYSEEGIRDSTDNDEISSWEEGFMMGYLET